MELNKAGPRTLVSGKSQTGSSSVESVVVADFVEVSKALYSKYLRERIVFIPSSFLSSCLEIGCHLPWLMISRTSYERYSDLLNEYIELVNGYWSCLLSLPLKT